MKEYQVRTPNLQAVMCSWEEWDERSARSEYEKRFKSAPKTDLRHGTVLVFAEWESSFEADRARMDWLDSESSKREVVIEVGKDLGMTHATAREALDVSRGKPDPKVTIIDSPNKI